jgi:uncharacterized membrane protein (DUF2068 family)
MHTASAPRAARRPLPFTLFVLAGLMLLKAMFLFGLVAGATVDSVRSLLGLSSAPGLVDQVLNIPGVSGLLVVVGVLLVISVVGMLTRHRLGWLIAMVITGLFVAGDIYSFANDGANHLWMGLNIVTVFYLNQRDVREAVGAAISFGADEPEPAR